MSGKEISVSLRLWSMLLSHLIMSLIVVPTLLLLDEYILPKSSIFGTISFYFFILIYLNKDFIFGKSISKRLLGLRIIDNRTNLPANELKCFIRNVTILIWPVEVVFTLFSTKRRIGDYLANTRIEISNKENLYSIIKDIMNFKFTAKTVFTLFVGVFYIVLLWYLFRALV